MCGRYALTIALEDLADYFDLTGQFNHASRYNIAPTQPILTVELGGSAERNFNLRRWGLIPHWVKDPDGFTLIINARSETAAQKASFKSAMRYRRILIPVSGFYEWNRPENPKAHKQAYWITGPTQIFAFAGLAETWMGKDGTEIDTACILTRASNETIGNIHHRMPVVIQPNDFDRWLDCKNHGPCDVADCFDPVQEDFFNALPVGDGVNKVANADPSIQQRVSLPQQPREAATQCEQMDLF